MMKNLKKDGFSEKEGKFIFLSEEEKDALKIRMFGRMSHERMRDYHYEKKNHQYQKTPPIDMIHPDTVLKFEDGEKWRVDHEREEWYRIC